MKSITNLLRCGLLLLCIAYCSAILAQSIKIQGKVVDASGEPVIGAAVVVQGTENGTVTDFDGVYIFESISGQSVLEFSYIGYETQIVPVEGRTTINVTLQEATVAMEELVVVGYGSLSKKELSSSIVQIDRKQFTQGAMNNAMEMLNGKVAGLNVVTTAAANPNGSSDLQIRGAGSITGSNSPLVVIDGIAGGDIRNIAAQDIESITVLKDAGSAAIYGTRGANGVILITTRKGAGNDAGHFTVTYDSYFAANVANDHPQVLSPDEFRRSRRGTDFGASTDWYSQIIKPATYDINQYLAVNGATKSGFYSASLNFKDAKGLDIASARREYGGRFAVEQKFAKDYLTIAANLSARRVDENWGDDGQVDNALQMNPTMPVYNADGSYYQPVNATGATNPVQRLKEVTNQGKRLYLLANADLKLKIYSNEHHNLTTNVNYALQYNDLKSDYYASSKSSESFWSDYDGHASISYSKYQTHRVEWLGNYDLNINKHTLKLLLGYSWERSLNEGASMDNYNFAYDNTLWNNIGLGTFLSEGRAGMNSWKNSNKLIGFFLRGNYNWNDEIFVAASFRREGSSRFGTNNKWGNFGSVSAAWEIASASFMKSAKPVVTSLKPRISWGVTGRDAYASYLSVPQYGQLDQYFMDGQWVVGYAPTANANPDLKWEKNEVLNAGFDFELWNRFRGSVEYYNRQQKDLLYSYTAPQPPYVYENILVNLGTTTNQGVEVSLNADICKRKNFNWNMGFNYSYGITRLTKLSNDIFQCDYVDLYQKPGVGTNEYFFRLRQGSLIGTFWGYEYAGHDENGNMLVLDNNNEPQLASKADAQWKREIGNGAPKHFLSWTNTFSFYNVDISMMWRGAFDYSIFNMRKYGMGLQGCGTDNVLRSAYLENKDVKTGGGVISSYFLERGDYFKLDNLTIGYTVRAPHVKAFDSFRVSLTAKNIATITRYSGNDPSIVPSTGITPGVDVSSAYPTATQISLGLTLNLK